jgi:hypothetical protein
MQGPWRFYRWMIDQENAPLGPRSYIYIFFAKLQEPRQSSCMWHTYSVKWCLASGFYVEIWFLHSDFC